MNVRDFVSKDGVLVVVHDGKALETRVNDTVHLMTPKGKADMICTVEEVNPAYLKIRAVGCTFDLSLVGGGNYATITKIEPDGKYGFERTIYIDKNNIVIRPNLVKKDEQEVEDE